MKLTEIEDSGMLADHTCEEEVISYCGACEEDLPADEWFQKAEAFDFLITEPIFMAQISEYLVDGIYGPEDVLRIVMQEMRGV